MLEAIFPDPGILKVFRCCDPLGGHLSGHSIRGIDVYRNLDALSEVEGLIARKGLH